MFFISPNVLVSRSSRIPLKYMGIPIQDASWLSSGWTEEVWTWWCLCEYHGILYLQLGLSCCPVLAAGMSSQERDTACKKRTSADRWNDFSWKRKILKCESQKLWELLRGCPCGIVWNLLQDGYAHSWHWSHTVLLGQCPTGVSWVSLTHLSSQDLSWGLRRRWWARQKACWGWTELWK